jgi:hypothetical protein
MGVALVAATARAQPGQVALAPTVYATHTVLSNAITAFTVTCPPGYLATSAGISKPAPGTTVLALAPVGVSGYRFRIGNPVTNGDQRVTVAVTCRKVRPASADPRFTLKLKPLKVRYLTVSPRRASSAALVCPPGTVPAGAGVDLAPGRQKAIGAYRAGPGVSVRRQTATLRRFSFSLLNLERRAKRVAVYGGCLTLAREAGAPRRRLHVRVTTFRVLLDPGAHAVTRRCRSGWYSLAAGYALRSNSTSAAGAAAVGASGRWSLLSDAEGDTTADVQLACARLGP